MRTVKHLLKQLVLAALASGSLAAAAHADDLAGIDEFVRGAMTDVGTPGVAVVVVRGQEIMLARGYGVREVDRPGAVDENTVFALGSNTKLFTRPRWACRSRRAGWSGTRR